jgi:CheY-like chemotaxis protein
MASTVDPPNTESPRPAVLIVDDTPAVADMIARWLRDEYRVYTANTGLDAIKLADEVHPQLALIDILMARPDGFEIAETLRAQQQHAGLAIIFMTGLVRAENATRASRVGAVDVLQKPLERQVVLACVRRALEG